MSLMFLPAGMPTVTFTDMAAMRLQTISFFLVAFLVSAWGVKSLWNLGRRDWPALPRLSYPAAIGFTTIWGLMFVLVLTMISGTRELLTPKAWEKTGTTYRLKGDESAASHPHDATAEERREHLQELGRELLAFAAGHEGRFPTSEETAEIATEFWQLPNRPASFYRYIDGLAVRDRERIVAFEPAMFGDDVFALSAEAKVIRLSSDELVKRLGTQEGR